MGDRKWENLPLNCLVDIFSRVGMFSLLDDKSWYEATLSPLCWQFIFFIEVREGGLSCYEYVDLLFHIRCNFTSFLNFVIRRSHGSVNTIALPKVFQITQDDLNFIGEGCPRLKRLFLPSGAYMNERLELSSIICKWKDLETLEISSAFILEKVIPEISVHCKKFVSLTIFHYTISEKVAYALATLLPDIEFLSFRGSLIQRSDLVTILKGCKKLVHFDSGRWSGFDLDDEIKNVAAHIKTFTFVVPKHEWSDESDSDTDIDTDSESDNDNNMDL